MSYSAAGRMNHDDVHEFITGLRQRKSDSDAGDREWVRQRVARRMGETSTPSKGPPKSRARRQSVPTSVRRKCSVQHIPSYNVGSEALLLAIAYVLGMTGFNSVMCCAVLGLILFTRWRRYSRARKGELMQREIALDRETFEELHRGMRIPQWAR